MQGRDLLVHFRPRLCPRCGYDLRGLVSLHKCPECGFDIEDVLLVQPPGSLTTHLAAMVLVYLGAVLGITALLDPDWLRIVSCILLGFVSAYIVWLTRPRNGIIRGHTALLLKRSGIVEIRGRRNRQLLLSDLSIPSLHVSAPTARKTKDGPVYLWHITIVANTNVPRMAGPLDAVVKGVPADGRIWTHFQASLTQGNALRNEIIRRHTKANCDEPLTPHA